MSYLSVISLVDAKTYLGVDDTARDTEITRMINSAFVYIETYTNVFVFAREKVYYKEQGNCLSVYDFPINSVVSPDVVEAKKRSLYTNYTLSDSDAELTLNIGYADPANVPSDIKEVALQMIEMWFYGTEKTNQDLKIPSSAKMVLDLHKRFII